VKEQWHWGKSRGSVAIIITFIVGKVGDVGEVKKKIVLGGKLLLKRPNYQCELVVCIIRLNLLVDYLRNCERTGKGPKLSTPGPPVVIGGSATAILLKCRFPEIAQSLFPIACFIEFCLAH
jgi:hypothetical protein